MSSAKETRQVIVVLGCVIQDGAVLLVRRNEPSMPALHGYWELPGGKIRIGERPADAAAREITEETGFAAQPVESLGLPFAALRRKADGSKLHVIGMGFRCRSESVTSPSHVRPKKVGQVAWIELSKLDPLKVQSASLAFIAAAIQGSEYSPTFSLRHPEVVRAQIELQSSDSRSNRNRHYAIVIQGYLANSPEFRVLRYWGRGAHTKFKVDEFSSRDSMIDFVNKQLRKRQSHNYSLVGTSPEFPEAIFPVVTELAAKIEPLPQWSLFGAADTDNLK